MPVLWALTGCGSYCVVLIGHQRRMCDGMRTHAVLVRLENDAAVISSVGFCQSWILSVYMAVRARQS